MYPLLNKIVNVFKLRWSFYGDEGEFGSNQSIVQRAEEVHGQKLSAMEYIKTNYVCETGF